MWYTLWSICQNQRSAVTKQPSTWTVVLSHTEGFPDNHWVTFAQWLNSNLLPYPQLTPSPLTTPNSHPAHWPQHAPLTPEPAWDFLLNSNKTVLNLRLESVTKLFYDETRNPKRGLVELTKIFSQRWQQGRWLLSPPKSFSNESFCFSATVFAFLPR